MFYEKSISFVINRVRFASVEASFDRDDVLFVSINASFVTNRVQFVSVEAFKIHKIQNQ